MEYLNNLSVDSFKGIRNISFQNFASVNLITGPNACGKSTVLDAIELIANPTDPMQFATIAKRSPKGFCSLFDKRDKQTSCKVSGSLLKKSCFTEFNSQHSAFGNIFRGEHRFGIHKNGLLTHHTHQVELSLSNNIPKIDSSLVSIKRISDDANDVSLANILKDGRVKEKVLSILSLFDYQITDIESPDFKNAYISHGIYGQLDISFFSAGIRKILKLADIMSGFQNGILLIDDFETHYSPQTMYEIVSLVYSLAKERQIQVFITTHSQELIDEWLDILNFYNELSHLKIIRMKSDGTASSLTEFTGKEAYELRMEKEIDFRYEYPNERNMI